MQYVVYMEEELRKFHINFGDPYVRAIESPLKREKGSYLDTDTRRAIKRI